jgi:nitrite reductase/ring-hydroxylating ferredoxin subunit
MRPPIPEPETFRTHADGGDFAGNGAFAIGSRCTTFLKEFPVSLTVDEPLQESRREFCVSAFQLASLIALGGVAACGGGPTSPSDAPSLPTVSSTTSGRTVAVTIDAGSPLASVGSAAILQNSLGSFLLARTGDTQVTALTAVCTHEGCTVTGFSNGQYVCPCHGSHFTTSGAVASGPASRSLQQFPSTLTDNVATFTV